MATLILLLLTSCCIAGANEIKVVKRPGSISEEEGSHEEVNSHLVVKRETQCLFFFLLEPPTSLQCNPQASKSLTLHCQLLVNRLRTPQQLNIGWFFSSNGETAELIQASRFVGHTPYSAFENMLVVLNPLPGAYFCSTAFVGVTQILYSRVLEISNVTLHEVCDIGESPTQQPPFPRCAQRVIPTPCYIPQPSTTFRRTNTINLWGGVKGSILTYSAGFKNTMNIPSETMATTLTPCPTPPATTTQQITDTAQIGTIAGVTVVVVVVVTMVVLVLPGMMYCLHSARKSRQHLDNPNVVPLMYHRPPNKPPPILNRKTKKVENIEMTELNHVTPSYEMATITTWKPRHIDDPAMENQKNKKKAARLPPPPVAPITQTPLITTYYSRPKFNKKEQQQMIERGFSTSTHIYGDLAFDNSTANDSHYTYIPVNHIKPFRQNLVNPQTSQEAAKDEALYQGNHQSCPAYAVSEFPSHLEDVGEEFYEYTDEEDEEDEEEEEEEDEDETNGRDPHYINAKGLQHIVEGAVYINSQRSKDEMTFAPATSYKTKTVPRVKKAKRKMRRDHRNMSLPTILVGEALENYTSLARDTLNYTSIYSNTSKSHESLTANRK